MKRYMMLIAAVVCATAVFALAGAETDRFFGGSYDGYEQDQLIQYNEANFLALVNARFKGGSYDGYMLSTKSDTAINAGVFPRPSVFKFR